MLLVPLAFLASAALAGATTLDEHLIARADVSACQAKCTALTNCAGKGASDSCCTNDLYGQLLSCYSCVVCAGGLSQSDANTTLNAFVQSCQVLGKPVTTSNSSASITCDAQTSGSSSNATSSSTNTTTSAPRKASAGDATAHALFSAPAALALGGLLALIGML